MEKAVGVDVGGTKTLFVLLNENGKVLKAVKHLTPKSRDELLQLLVKGIKEVKKNEKLKGIGFSFAGFLDSEQGIMHFSPNMPYINNFNFKAYLKRHFKEPLFFENDANAFALAEYSVGYKRKYKNLIGITLGTGVGSGIICEGLLIKGQGRGAEIGHMIIDHSSGRICSCGNPGCFEAHCNGKALLDIAKEKGLTIKSNEELHKFLKRRDKRAINAVKEFSEHLAIGFVNIINIFDPEVIVVGGGLSKISSIIENAKKELSKYTLVRKNTKILPAKLGNVASAVGAAMLAFEHKKRNAN
ncbi:MAG: ROK family protein [Candidatus Diapherotrites archaeon]